MEEEAALPPAAVADPGRLLPMMRTTVFDGVVHSYVASSQETVDCIEAQLQRRRNFMQSRGIAPDPTGGHYVFTNDMRKDVLQEW